MTHAHERSNYTRSRRESDDPLWLAIRPPKDEDPAARAARVKEDEEASRRSHEIDVEIAEAKKGWDKRKKAVKVLLLGQAESGKSTTLKNFQLTFSPSQFKAERRSWKIVIQLNLVQSVKRILDTIQEELHQPTPPPSPTPWQPPTRAITSSSIAYAEAHSSNGAGSSSSAAAASGPASPTPQQPQQQHAPLTAEHRKIVLRLRPLIEIELTLAQKLNPQAVVDSRMKGVSLQEIVVRAEEWKRSLTQPPMSPSARNGKGRARLDENGNVIEDIDDPTKILSACVDDIVTLWGDRVVREVLKKRDVRLEEMPGFFLPDARRICAPDYEPTDDDILKARLRTLGVEEHRFTMENLSAKEWLIYDVAGCRGTRHIWVPYFEDVQAIIFLVPLVFNQVLEEDPKVNRLEDSFSLWKKICSNDLLKKAALILFLNKIDILREILKSGVKLKQFVPSYGDQPNDFEHVTRYFRSKFKAFQKALSPQARVFYCHETTVIDAKSTSVILIGVREGIMRAHLERANVL